MSLIEAGAEVNKADNNGKTPLYYVADRGGRGGQQGGQQQR
jgi:ankyrin repeat protein